MAVSKYTKCKDINFKNFPECLHNNNNDNGNRDQKKYVGTFGSCYICYLAVEKKVNEASGKEDFVFGILFIDRLGVQDKLEVRYKCFMKNSDKSDVQCKEVKEIVLPQWSGHDIYKYTENKYDMEEILNESNGFLKDGRLTIRVKISVDAIISDNGIRRWGFPRFKADRKQWAAISMKWLNDSAKVYVNRQIMEFHAPSHPKNEQERGCGLSIDQLLQIMHGVQPFDEYHSYVEMLSVIHVARDHKIHNVLRICEQHLISEYRLGYHRSGFWKDALNSNLRSYLKVLLEKVESPNELKRKLKHVELEESSAEIMKQLVAKFLSFV